MKNVSQGTPLIYFWMQYITFINGTAAVINASVARAVYFVFGILVDLGTFRKLLSLCFSNEQK